MLAITSRTLAARMAPMRLARGFGTSSARQNAASGISVSPLPPRKPIGALRGGLFGFFLGTTAAGAGVYYYAVQEYKASNELLTEDIYALQRAVDRLSGYLGTLEERLEALERRSRR